MLKFESNITPLAHFFPTVFQAPSPVMFSAYGMALTQKAVTLSHGRKDFFIIAIHGRFLPIAKFPPPTWKRFRILPKALCM